MVSTAIVHLAIYQAIEPFTLLFLRDIGVSYFLIGLLDAIYSVIIIFSVMVGSYLFSEKRSRFSAVNCAVWGIMCMFYSIATGFWSAVVVFVIAGLSFTFHAASMAYTLEQSRTNSHFAMGFFALSQIPLIFMFVLLLRSFRLYGFVPGMRKAFEVAEGGWVPSLRDSFRSLSKPPELTRHRKPPAEQSVPTDAGGREFLLIGEFLKKTGSPLYPSSLPVFVTFPEILEGSVVFEPFVER